jgi:3-oxoacyl-[acyl-carrier protein] reductase
MNQLDFRNCSAVVTGGAAGIGLAVARRLVAGGALTIAVGVTSVDAVETAASETEAVLGGIDVLVCSAGIAGPTATTWDYPVDACKHVSDVNVHGLFCCNRAVVPEMRSAGYGRIVNIASIAGKELAATGIRVNCVTPAAVRTAIYDQMSPQHVDFMLSKSPPGRFRGVDEVASVVCRLAPEESSFSTGVVFDLSGGRATY